MIWGQRLRTDTLHWLKGTLKKKKLLIYQGVQSDFLSRGREIPYCLQTISKGKRSPGKILRLSEKYRQETGNSFAQSWKRFGKGFPSHGVGTYLFWCTVASGPKRFHRFFETMQNLLCKEKGGWIYLLQAGYPFLSHRQFSMCNLPPLQTWLSFIFSHSWAVAAHHLSVGHHSSLFRATRSRSPMALPSWARIWTPASPFQTKHACHHTPHYTFPKNMLLTRLKP